jgi:hypothetical protein
MNEMMAYYVGDTKRINHFVKVYGFAKTLGELEQLDDASQAILETVAVTHDIGIKVSEEKYHSPSGKYQEIEGPNLARDLLRRLGYREEDIEKVCHIIAHHHTYKAIDSKVFQLLVEADFLVNCVEEDLSLKAIKKIKTNIFKTESGILFLNHLFKEA